MEVRYQDEAQKISLTGYADTLIVDSQYTRLVGIRVGGLSGSGIRAVCCDLQRRHGHGIHCGWQHAVHIGARTVLQNRVP